MENVRRPTTRRAAGQAAIVAGVSFVLCAALVNRWTVGFLKGERAVDLRDVFEISFRWSLFLGVATLALGFAVLRTRSKALSRLAISWLVVAVCLVADRLLLAHLGLPLWVHDAEAHFRHRPNAVRVAPRAPGGERTLVRINSHGFHDEEFPLEKPAGELRGLMLGDSVTMGHMLAFEETFSERLEELLDERDSRYSSHQIINAGVQGYATFQEVVAFQNALAFSPDFVVLGFCLNDVTEPFVVQREFGGTGLDYHEVLQEKSAFVGYLKNETGIGRCLLAVRQRATTAHELKQWEDYNVRSMTLGSTTEPRFQQAWAITLRDLGRVYALAAEHRLPFVLLIFPYTFQLFDPTVLEPQRIVNEHAARHQIDVIDFTSIFRERIVANEEEVAGWRDAGIATEEILNRCADSWRRFYIDTNHFAPEGHRLVAEVLFQHLVQKGVVTDGPP